MIEAEIKETLEILGSGANFLGGIVLLVDALRAPRVVKVKKAVEDFQAELKAGGVTELNLPVDKDGSESDGERQRAASLIWWRLKRVPGDQREDRVESRSGRGDRFRPLEFRDAADC